MIEIALITFKWGLGISIGILMLGVVELFIFIGIRKIFLTFFEPAGYNENKRRYANSRYSKRN